MQLNVDNVVKSWPELNENLSTIVMIKNSESTIISRMCIFLVPIFLSFLLKTSVISPIELLIKPRKKTKNSMGR